MKTSQANTGIIEVKFVVIRSVHEAEVVTFLNSIENSNFQVLEMFDPIRVLDL